MSNMGVDSTHTNIFGSCCGPWGIGQGISGTKYQAMPPSYRGYLVMRQQMLRRPQLSSHRVLHLMQLLQRWPQLRHCHPDLQSQTFLTCCSCSTSTHSVLQGPCLKALPCTEPPWYPRMSLHMIPCLSMEAARPSQGLLLSLLMSNSA